MNIPQKTFRILIIIFVINLLSESIKAQIPCENGMSGIYPCKSINLLSRISAEELLAENTNGVWLNDIWGWTDPVSSKEYALVGMSNGTSFVDVTDPFNPVILGLLPEHESASGGRSSRANSVWRDIKVFKNHAFIVSEDPTHGMQIFDLENLRDVQNPPETFSETKHFGGVGGAHNLAINEATGFAYVTGSRESFVCNGGGLYIIDINDPINPQYAGCVDQGPFTHDTQCVIYNGPDANHNGQEICFNSNEVTIAIVDVTDKSNPIQLAGLTYDGITYAHQGWLSEDHKYFFSNDELDELQIGNNTKTFVWDLEDLDKPVLISTFEHEGTSIDHNLYVKGDLIFQSNYTAGLRILNSKPLTTSGLNEVAYFDTYQQDNGQTFQGSWSNYPYFESGNIIVSDIVNGLFILKHNIIFDETAPTIPLNLIVTHIDGTRSINVDWDDSQDDAGVFGYRLYLNEVNKESAVTTTESEYLFTNLAPNVSHTIFIEAFDHSGNISDRNFTTTTIVVSSLEFSDTHLLKLYPNPATYDVVLDFTELSFLQATLKMYDFSGKNVTNLNLDLATDKKVSLNTSSLKKGLYHIRITNGSDRITKKLRIH